MKVLHVNSYYQAGKFYKHLYDRQVEKGYQLDVFVPTSHKEAGELFNYGAFTCISVDHQRWERLFFHRKHRKILSDAISKYDINSYRLVHAHSLFSNGYIAMKIKEKFGIPYVVAVRNTDVNVFFKRMIHLRSLGRRILDEASHVVFLSHTYKEFVLNEYVKDEKRSEIDGKSEIIPNGVDPFWMQHKPEDKSPPKDKEINLLAVGDISVNKNVKTTAQAVEVLMKKGYSVNLTAIGKVKDKKVFSELNEHKFFTHIPFQTKEELIEEYRRNHVMVMPSIHETFGLVYAEAMSQGLPVIYTKGQGFDGQFVEGQVGYAVESMDADGIAETIVTIVNEYESISERCVQLVEKFNWDAIVKDYDILYENMSI